MAHACIVFQLLALTMSVFAQVWPNRNFGGILLDIIGESFLPSLCASSAPNRKNSSQKVPTGFLAPFVYHASTVRYYLSGGVCRKSFILPLKSYHNILNGNSLHEGLNGISLCFSTNLTLSSHMDFGINPQYTQSINLIYPLMFPTRTL